MLCVCPPILALVHLVCFACDHFFFRHLLCPPSVPRLSREVHGFRSKIGFHGALGARRRLFYLFKSTRAANLQLLSGASVSSSWTPGLFNQLTYRLVLVRVPARACVLPSMSVCACACMRDVAVVALPESHCTF